MSRTGIQQTLINHVYKCNLRLVNTRYRNFVTYITKKKKIKVYWYYNQAIYCIENYGVIADTAFGDQLIIHTNYEYFNKESLILGYDFKYRSDDFYLYGNIIEDEMYIDGKDITLSVGNQLINIIDEEANVYIKIQKALEFFHMVRSVSANNKYVED